jgi:HAD superfamily hydrolase (TIGR01549 family)
MEGKKIKAVLFDLGETVLNFGRVKTLGLFFEGARLSFTFLKERNEPVCNFAWYCCHSLMSLYLHRGVSHITGNDFDAMVLLKKIGSKRGIDFDEEQWRDYAWCWYEPLERIGRVEEGIDKTLDKLKNMGLKIGILSNTFVPRSCLERHLDELGVLGFFDARFYSYEFDFRKPDERIFAAAAEKIGEKLENIAFVGDRVDKDIEPALKTGMHGFLKNAYTNGGKETPDGAYRINHLSELPGHIEKINLELKKQGETGEA